VTVQYKVPQAVAQAMAQNWINMVPSVMYGPSITPAQLAQSAAHWATEIQQDGSNSAFQDFANSIAKQHGPAAQSELASNAALYTKQTGLAPWTPAQGAVNGQLPGTNTKSGGAEIGKALTSPVGQVVEGVIAGALDVVSDGALTPITTAGLAAIQGIGTGIQPGANFGTIAKATALGAGEGALAGTGASLLDSATGGALVTGAGMSVPDAATMSPSALAAAANATPGTVGSAAAALPGAAAVGAGTKLASNVVGASNPSTSSNPVGGVSSLLNNIPLDALAVAQGANAASLGQESNDYAQQAANDATSRWNAQAPLRTAGIAGMLNPTSPFSAPSLPKGNPFAPPGPAAVPSGSTTPPASGISAMLNTPTTPTPVATNPNSPTIQPPAPTGPPLRPVPIAPPVTPLGTGSASSPTLAI
jgi:hypothetical protein